MNTIFVGNLAFDVTEHEVRAAFERHGVVRSVQLMTDRGTGKFRGFAFVRMPYFEDAEEAIARMNGSSLRGRTLTANAARERPAVPQRTMDRLWSLV